MVICLLSNSNKIEESFNRFLQILRSKIEKRDSTRSKIDNQALPDVDEDDEEEGFDSSSSHGHSYDIDLKSIPSCIDVVDRNRLILEIFSGRSVSKIPALQTCL